MSLYSNFELRQSVINDYLNCPLLFHFKHVQGIRPRWRHPSALHGTTLHMLLYLIHQVGWIKDLRAHYLSNFNFLEFQYKPDCEIPVYWKEGRQKQLEAYWNNAEEILTGYWNRPENRHAVVLYAEQYFRVRIGRYQFTGTVNQVRRNVLDDIELVDFSSSRYAPTIAGLYNDLQLNLYAYAMANGEFLTANGWQPADCPATFLCRYHLRGHEVRRKTSKAGRAGEEKLAEPLFRVACRGQRLSDFKYEILRLVEDLSKGVQYPNPNFCPFCPYTNICMKREIITRG